MRVMPDPALASRVAALKGLIELRTLVSLSCTNCPDVAQDLNPMALIHGAFRHTVIDGALAPDEVARLGIQGVPAVFAGDRLIHSGKADFGVLLEALRKLPNVTILSSARTTEIVGDGSSVHALRWEDRNSGEIVELPLEDVFAQIGLVLNSASVMGLVRTTKRGEIEIDERGRTSVPGIYAAGDVTTVPFKQIVIAMGEGAKAALGAFEDRLREAG